eukprot:210121-Prorocentrum_lima.AAC.1
MEYDMEEFMTSCVTTYCDLAKVARASLPMVATPFLPDSLADDGVGGPAGKDTDDINNALGDLLTNCE